jgi:hypothetical protein
MLTPAAGFAAQNPAAAVSGGDHADGAKLSDPLAGDQVGDEPGAGAMQTLESDRMDDPGCMRELCQGACLREVDSEWPLRKHVLAGGQRRADDRSVARNLDRDGHKIHVLVHDEIVGAVECERRPKPIGGLPGALHPRRRHRRDLELRQQRERRQVRARTPAAAWVGTHDANADRSRLSSSVSHPALLFNYDD